MRALSGRSVAVQDKLFATLDTKTAVVEVLKNRRVLLSDTVGFISKIPHHLIASFHATLEEVLHADLLLHVIDVSHPDPKSQIDAVNGVLGTLGCAGKTVIHVLNKVDAIKDHLEVEYLRRLYPDHVVVSALRGTGLDALRERIAREMAKGLAEVPLAFPVANGRAIAFIRDRAEVIEERFEGEEAIYRVRISKKNLGALRSLLAGHEIPYRCDGSFAPLP